MIEKSSYFIKAESVFLGKTENEKRIILNRMGKVFVIFTE